MAVTYPTIMYGQASTINTVPRLIQTQLGDGYQSVIADGINYLPRNGTLVHPNITNAQAATLLTFLRTYTNGTVVTIKNYMEDPSGATDLNVRLESWSQTTDGITQTYNVNFREAFST